MAQEYLEHCPLCNSSSFISFYTCKDFLNSGEQFELKQCVTCSFVITNPRPDAASLPSYYQSIGYISHSAKATDLVNFLYLQARKFTLQWKTSFLQTLTDRSSILDYGCGTGNLLALCQAQGWSVSGVEPSEEARTIATKITGTKIAAALDELGTDNFDIITLWHVLEHIPDLNQKIRQLKLRLKENGYMVIAVPNYESFDGLYYKEYWAGYDVPRHLWHFTKDTMNKLFIREGLRVQSIVPMKLDAYYVSVLSEKYKFPKRLPLVNLLKGIMLGFRSNRRARSKSNYSSLIYVITR